MKKITVIDNYDSFVFNLVRYIEELGCEVEVQRNDRIDFTSIQKSDGILLSPGPGIPSEAGQLFDVIEKYHQTKRILGVCLGHQAIAEYFGGSISNSNIAIHGKASDIIKREKSTLFNSLPDEFPVGRYHSWNVDKIPSNFKLTASTKDNIVMAIEHKQLPIFGVQFHPESILTPQGRTIIQNFIR
ncbi:MAG: aminodeoxychorismate/anthranilate synthase component II [Crocinitomicaceae bacterium]|nr:aminodeoxychorismate/anthranilate synthase component II [Crocinitomicaceae bacterium]